MTELSLEDALKMADEQELDLVMLSEKDNKAICKLMNYSKFVYNKQKVERKNKKSTQQSKEIRFDCVIADNDMKIKANQATRILNDGHTVRVSVFYKGRLVQRISDGKNLLDKFTHMIESKYTIGKKPSIEGNRVTMTIIPSK